MPGGQVLFDAPLAFEEPIHGVIEIIGGGHLEAEFFPKGMREGGGAEATGRSQFGLGIKEPGNDHGDHKMPLRARVGIHEALEPQVSERPQHRGDMPVWARAHDVKGLMELRNGSATTQEGL
jgi:hypothetical protein